MGSGYAICDSGSRCSLAECFGNLVCLCEEFWPQYLLNGVDVGVAKVSETLNIH